MKEQLLHRKFEHIYKVIRTPRFLSLEALGGEIPFWISAYDPHDEVMVNQEIHNLIARLKKNDSISAHLVNLFELSIFIADQHLGRDKLFEIEKMKSGKKRSSGDSLPDKKRFMKALQSVINIHERLIPSIREQIEQNKPDLFLINGVGAVYPFIRSHTILNNLQSAVTDIPTLMFFPGTYTGRSLELFGLLKDDNYYRAFNIDQYKV